MQTLKNDKYSRYLDTSKHFHYLDVHDIKLFYFSKTTNLLGLNYLSHTVVLSNRECPW